MEAVVVVDMIKDFVTGKFGFQGAQQMVPRLQSVLQRARERGVPVIFTCDSHKGRDPELSLWGEHAMKGTEGARVVPELGPAEGDLVIEKRTYSSFFETKLEKILKKRRVTELILAGVVTNICIQHTAADAFFRGFKVSILSDCTSCPEPAQHSASLKYMREIYGATILTSKELLERWK